MNLPFTTEQFFQVFASYNQAIWPAQLIAYLTGAWAVWSAVKPRPFPGRVIPIVLSAFWIWAGLVYHFGYFSAINRAAYFFALLFVLQGGLFIYYRKRLGWKVQSNARAVVGMVFILYAMIIYPLLGVRFGHSWSQTPMFGVAPCPVTIFTFGLLLWAQTRVPWQVLVIPFLWSLIGISAALQMGVRQDWGLLVAGVVGTAMILAGNRKPLSALAIGGIPS